MSEPTAASTEASKTITAIFEGKVPKLLTLVPKGNSPKVYLDLVKAQVMGVDKAGKTRSDEDLLLFLYVAKRTGLDPLTKQIYAVFRWNSRQEKEVMTIQTSIDGMRLVAQRTKQYAGQDDVVYDPKDEVTKYPKKASVTVYKFIEGQRVAFTASARWTEYLQTDSKGTPTQMWEHMPYLMLGKCAEALALRKAFPNELSGIYADEEMQQANNPLLGITPPEKFAKPEVEVVHGAPETETTASQTEQLNANKTQPDGYPPVITGTSGAPSVGVIKYTTPDFAKMREEAKGGE